MEVNTNYASPVASAPAKAVEAKAKEAPAVAPVETKPAAPTAKEVGYIFETSKASERKNYKPDTEKVTKMLKEAEEKAEAFKNMIEKLLLKQGQTMDTVLGKIKNGEEVTVEVDEATRAAAADSISEDGYYGVKQTSERILEFAKAVSGGDPAKIDKLREAVKKGFEGATQKFGKELPEISQKTYEAVMKGFDDWKNESKTASATDYTTNAIAGQAAATGML